MKKVVGKTEDLAGTAQNLVGKWKFYQKWGASPGYSFPAEFTADGKILIEGGFFGTYRILGDSNQIALAINNVGMQSISAYVGNILGNTMGGQARGTTPNGRTNEGVWSASHQEVADAPEQKHHIPG